MTTQLIRVASKPSDYNYVEDEYRFYEEEEGYSETEIDNIEIEC